jgi:uncharacterized protein (TIGR02594 family)
MLEHKGWQSLDAPWMRIATKHVGEGSINHEYFAHTKYGIPPDNQHVPWCAAFVCTMLELTGYKSPHSARASDFIGFGRELKTPVYGAIIVFEWENHGHHVSFAQTYFGGPHISCLGGNQHNLVKESSYNVKNIVWIGWPTEQDDKV